VLDVGAGSGRATFECLRYGAKEVYAVEPSPGLLRILKRKSSQNHGTQRITPLEGRFDAVPLPDNSVDVTLSCSAFTALPEQGGESGLVELQRVTKPNGKIILIWPRSEDHEWLKAHDFSYVSLPMQQEMSVHFRSLHTALECAHRFYAHNQAVLHYLYSQHSTDVPFSLIGMNPPHEYCWRTIEK
jgi:ubiquinone/menaquinone biosynthesis C-methylase UbiE